MMKIPLIVRRPPDPLPAMVAGYIKDQEFVAVEADPPELVLQEPEFFLGARVIQSLPQDAVIQLDEFEYAATPNQLRARLIFRRGMDNFRKLHTLDDRDPPPAAYEWMAVEPTIASTQDTSKQLSVSDWIKAAKAMNNALLGIVPDFTRLPVMPEPVLISESPSPGEAGSQSTQENRPFEQFLLAHAQPAPSINDKIEAPPLPEGTSNQALRATFNQYRHFYPTTVAAVLDQMLSKPLSGREQRRAVLLLQYGFCRRAVAPTFDHQPFQQPLTGRGEALQKMDDVLQRVEQTHRTQTVLLHAPRGQGAGCLLNRLKQGSDKMTVAFVDCNQNGISLTGTSPIYDQATEGTFIQSAFWADIIILQNFETAYHNRHTDKDSAYPAIATLLSRHTWLDRFVGVSLEVPAKIILVLTQEYPPEMQQTCSALFLHTIQLPEYTLEEKCQIVQDRAAAQGLHMTRAAAETLVRDFAPLSLVKAVHQADRLITVCGSTCDAPDVSRCLRPALSPDERLASRYWHSRNTMCPAARDLAEEQMGILSRSTNTKDRDTAHRILAGMLDCLPVQESLPPQDQIRRSFDRDLLGLESLKDAVSRWAANSKDRRGLLLVGPPGVAKTAISTALSQALGFGNHPVRLDMSHMTRHQMCGTGKLFDSIPAPGIIAENTRRYQGRQIPFVFDELDKASPEILYTLLELLDSGFFSDNAYGPLDQRYRPLIFTANELGPIPRPVLDRLMVLHVAPYCRSQKVKLAAFLWQHTLPAAPPLPPQLCETLVDGWAISGGARDLQHIIQRLSAAYDADDWDPGVTDSDSLCTILGKPAYILPPVTTRPGMSYALAVCTDGSGVLTPVQAVSCEQEGNYGLGSTQSMNDSAGLARFLARRLAGKNACSALLAMDADPGGRSGPSAGLAEFAALYSLFQRLTLPGVAATGELLAQGQVRPIGGVRSKIDAVVRGKDVVHHLFLPEGNREDVDLDLRRALTEAGVQLHFVSHVGETAHILNKIALLPPHNKANIR